MDADQIIAIFAIVGFAITVGSIAYVLGKSIHYVSIAVTEKVKRDMRLK